MSFAEILEEIPKLSFVERQEVIRRAVSPEDAVLMPDEEELLDARMADFAAHPEAGVLLEQLKATVQERLRAK